MFFLPWGPTSWDEDHPNEKYQELRKMSLEEKFISGKDYQEAKISHKKEWDEETERLVNEKTDKFKEINRWRREQFENDPYTKLAREYQRKGYEVGDHMISISRLPQDAYSEFYEKRREQFERLWRKPYGVG